MTQLYVDTGYDVGDDYAQTGITIDWGQRVIFVPRSELTLVQSTPSYVYTLDLSAFRLALTDLEDSVDGMAFLQTHNHNTTVTISGVTYARLIEIINDYVVEFEDGQYAVNLIGANSNIADKVVVNQVSVRPNNSAGLVDTGISTTELAAAVLAAANVTPIDANVRQMNSAPVQGTGTAGDLWRGV